MCVCVCVLPPGTGKTNVGIKLVYLFCKINRQLQAEGKGKKTVLYCGPSNKSVDLVASECPADMNRLCTSRSKNTNCWVVHPEEKLAHRHSGTPQYNNRSASVQFKEPHLKLDLHIKDTKSQT